jgi:hypothetical protein
MICKVNITNSLINIGDLVMHEGKRCFVVDIGNYINLIDVFTMKTVNGFPNIQSLRESDSVILIAKNRELELRIKEE